MRMGAMGAAALGVLATVGPVSADEEVTPAENYRRGAFAFMAGTAVTSTVGSGGFLAGSGGSQGLVQMGVEGRQTAGGLMVAARLGVLYPNSVSTTTLGTGLSVGVAVPLASHIAVTPYLDVGIGFDTKPVTVVVGPGGAVGLQFFVGRHGFIEPYVGGQALVAPASGTVIGAFLVGYRLGVVF